MRTDVARDDAAERQHRNLSRAAADIDDQVAERAPDRHPGPDRRRDRLLDEVHRLAGPGELGRFLHCVAAELGGSRRHAHHDSGPPPPPFTHAAEEDPQHLLTGSEIGDGAVFQRAEHFQMARCPAEHLLRRRADRDDPAIAAIDRDGRWLVDDDTPPSYVGDGVGGAEVDGDAQIHVVLPFRP